MQGKCWISGLLRSFLHILGVKLQKLDKLLLNLVVAFEARRIKDVTPLRAAEAPKQLVIRVKRGNKRSHTDCISLSLAAEGAMHA